MDFPFAAWYDELKFRGTHPFFEGNFKLRVFFRKRKLKLVDISPGFPYT